MENQTINLITVLISLVVSLVASTPAIASAIYAYRLAVKKLPVEKKMTDGEYGLKVAESYNKFTADLREELESYREENKQLREEISKLHAEIIELRRELQECLSNSKVVGEHLVIESDGDKNLKEKGE